MRWNDVIEMYVGRKTANLDTVQHLPHANGTALDPPASVRNTDNDDGATIGASMCYSLWELDYGAGAWCYCDNLINTDADAPLAAALKIEDDAVRAAQAHDRPTRLVEFDAPIDACDVVPSVACNPPA